MTIKGYEEYTQQLNAWFYGKEIPPEQIREMIKGFSKLPNFPPIDESTIEEIARNFEASHGITMSLGSNLFDPTFQPWLQSKKAEINPYYWERYKTLLIRQSFSNDVINKMDAKTDQITGWLEDPGKEGTWSRKGLVVGNVQSGKTANYIGVMNKAADAGYKVIIVIAGLNNKLRNQTQIRIEEGFVGRDSSSLTTGSPTGSYFGVGLIEQTRMPGYLTTRLRDFNKIQATSAGIPFQNMIEPAVLVIKKNSGVLKNLLEWIQHHNLQNANSNQINEPLLVIDDEADNASINIKYGKDEVSRINSQIRALLKVSKRSCYVGYTATPFANIFIDPDTDDEMLDDDLFPKHFIESLDPPSNYLGPDYFFLGAGQSSLVTIDDEISEGANVLPLKHSRTFALTGLPQSLEEAIGYFVIARAIRIQAGDGSEHSSMLVNASVYNDVQAQLRGYIQEYLSDMESCIRVNGSLPVEKALQDHRIAGLHKIWAKYADIQNYPWGSIQDALLQAVAPIQVPLINGKSKDTLNYSDYKKDGMHSIAVGGYTLSRGLTLEGLMVSYFFRGSILEDTLLQMGRWFGYRDAYADLCKIWLTEESQDHYKDIAEDIMELRDEFKKMSDANATPSEFGLKVRSHPGVLMMTARNKMGSSQEVISNVGLHNQFIETTTVHGSPTEISNNRNATDKFISGLIESGVNTEDTPAGSGMSGHVLKNVDVERVLEFIGDFKNHPGSHITEIPSIRDYIIPRATTELGMWDIYLPSLQSGDKFCSSIGGLHINCQLRTSSITESLNNGPLGIKLSNNKRVSSRGIEKIGVSPEKIKAAEEAFEKQQIEGGSTAKNTPDYCYRAKRSKPLLVIHLIQPVKPKLNGQSISENPLIDEPVIAVSISFPDTSTPKETTVYRYNTTLLKELADNHLGDDEDDNE